MSVRLSPALFGSILATSLWLLPVHAIQRSDGTTQFIGIPRLEKVVTSESGAGAVWATYYVTITVPANASASLQKLVLQQTEGVETIAFRLDESEAFEGEWQGGGPKLGLGEILANSDDRSLSVTFQPAIPPGKTVTLGVRPVQNPIGGGIYLLGITAVPTGDRPRREFLGFGRLHFYGNFDSVRRRF